MYNKQIHSPLTGHKPFRGINIVPGVQAIRVPRFYAIEIQNQQELENLEDFIFRCDLAAADYTSEGSFPKYLAVPDVDQLQQGHLLRIYAQTFYPIKDSKDTIFKGIKPVPVPPSRPLHTLNESLKLKHTAAFYAISPENFKELETSLKSFGLNAGDLLKSLKAVSL